MNISTRKTIRKYTQQPISDELLNRLLEEASHTQTMGNLQLYSVVVTRSQEAKQALAPFDFNQPMVTQAPVVLTICADFRRVSDWCECRQAVPGYDNMLSFMNAATDALLYTQTFCNLAEEQGLANQVPSIPNQTLIFSVAAGVGLFLTVAFLRMLLGVALPPLLVAFYGLVFVLAAFVPREFLAVAFDSGGVTTGPMTVPFIMALGVGVSAIRGDRHAADDSFGLVALCSVGPILAVLILGIAFRASDSTYIPPVLPEVSDSVELWQLFHEGLPEYIKEIASSLLPIVVMFGVFQAVALRLDKRTLGRIAVGLAYTYVGLVLFLTGANVGFMPAGNYLGQVLTGQSYHWVIIPIGMLIGYFIVKAEPAVYVLNKQVEEVTDGAISAQAMGMALSAGVSISVGLAMVRVLTGISILWFLIPGYAVAIGISFVVPKLFTAIAFDAGGVASGPMTATFLLPLAQGACVAVGGNIVTDAFGVVAMVAMTPLITVQLMGLAAQLKTGRRRAARAAEPALAGVAAYADWPDDDIIEL